MYNSVLTATLFRMSEPMRLPIPCLKKLNHEDDAPSPDPLSSTTRTTQETSKEVRSAFETVDRSFLLFIFVALDDRLLIQERYVVVAHSRQILSKMGFQQKSL